MVLTDSMSVMSVMLNHTCIVAVIISVETPYFGAPSPKGPKTTSMCCAIIVSAALLCNLVPSGSILTTGNVIIVCTCLIFIICMVISVCHRNENEKQV